MLLWWTEVKFFCYVTIIIATVLSGVLCWGLVSHFILVSFLFVFGCHIYLTLHGMCWYCSLHYFTVSCICLTTCLHVLLALCAPGCNITSFRWTQPCWALHLRLMLQFGYIINCLSLPCSAVSSFWLSYTFIDSKFRVIFAFSWSWNLCNLSKFMCMNELVLLKLQN